MPEFNRHDICAAYYLFGGFYHNGQFSKEYAYMGRARKCGFEPGISFSGMSLSENAREIYQALVSKAQRKGGYEVVLTFTPKLLTGS